MQNTSEIEIRNGQHAPRVQLPALAEADFVWDSNSMKAALCFAGVLLPPGRTGPRDVARAVGVPVETINQWRYHPDFCARVDHIIRNSTEAIVEAGLALKTARLMEKQKRHRMLMDVIESRQEWAAEWAPNDIVTAPATLGEEARQFMLPGIGSGALVVRLKSVGSGAFQSVVPEAAFDTALFAELRALERDIAMELGQLNPESSVNINMKYYANIDLSRV